GVLAGRGVRGDVEVLLPPEAVVQDEGGAVGRRFHLRLGLLQRQQRLEPGGALVADAGRRADGLLDGGVGVGVRLARAVDRDAHDLTSADGRRRQRRLQLDELQDLLGGEVDRGRARRLWRRRRLDGLRGRGADAVGPEFL